MTTLLHELGRCFVYESMKADHENKWHTTTAYLMAILNSASCKQNIEGMNDFIFCARKFGVNLIRK